MACSVAKDGERLYLVNLCNTKSFKNQIFLIDLKALPGKKQ
jgi:hypothetical protein